MEKSSSVEVKFNNPFASLKQRNFRIFWSGMCVSLIGTWMQNIAQPWLAYKLTDSPFLLSLIGTLQFTPMLFFSLFAGVLIDKFSKKKILIFTQIASLFITLVLAILVWLGNIQYWHILVMAVALGIINTVDMPARQAFVSELVDKEHLMNAIAMNSMAFNLARIIGPAIAGIIMGVAGVAVCFFINSLSFAAVLISLFFLKSLPSPRTAGSRAPVLGEIMDGLRYIRKDKVILSTLLVLAVVGTFAPNFNVLVPVFSKTILLQSEAGYGFLMSFLGFGSLIGAIFIAAISKAGPRKALLYVVPYVIGAFLAITGFASSFALTALSLAVTGFFFVAFTSNCNSTVQVHTSNEYRGRVMSVYTLVFAGSTPIGNLYAGIFSDRFSARIGFISCGAASCS